MSVKRWLGNAAAVTDQWTISLSGTVTNQVYSVTINGKSITYSATATDTVDTIIATLVGTWNSLNPLPPPEFQELTAAGLPVARPFTSMTLTQDLAGRPSSISVSTTGGASIGIVNTTPATGPNFFDNGQNWSSGTGPTNSDTLVFDNGSVACKYNLSTSLTATTISIEPGFSGQIGLPFINVDASASYAEYRPTSLSLAGGTVAFNGPRVSRCNLDFGPNTASVRILGTGQRLDNYTPVVLLTGGNASSELDVSKGDVGIAFYQGQSAIFPSIKTGYVTSPASDVNLTAGSGANLTNITKNGGSAMIRCNAATITQDTAGGTLAITDSSVISSLNVLGGTVILSTNGNIGTISLYNAATLDSDQDPRAKSISNPINVYSPSVTIRDSQKTINSGTLSITANGCESVNVSHGANSSIVYR